MKITKTQLKRIIKEELQKSLEEGLMGAMKGALGFDPYGPEEEAPAPASDGDGKSDDDERSDTAAAVNIVCHEPNSPSCRELWPPPMTQTGLAYLKTLGKSEMSRIIAAAHPELMRKRGWQEDAIQRAVKSLTDADRVEYIVHARGDIRV